MRNLLCAALTVATFQAAYSTEYRVAPNDRANLIGGGTFLGPLTNVARTYQLIIAASQLTGLQGRELDGITFRLAPATAAAWPVTSVTYTNFDVYLSESVAPPLRNLTFALNVVGTQTQVRSGPLTVVANAFPLPGSGLDFGVDIRFLNHIYTGGNLLVEIRHSGFSGTSAPVDAVLTTGSGYGSTCSACWTGSYTGTSGSPGNFAVSRLRLANTRPISGVANLSNFTGSPLGRQLSFTLTNTGSTTTVFSTTALLGANGAYALEVPLALPLSSYDLYIDGTPWLKKRIGLNLAVTGASGVNFTLNNGDVDNSGEVDASDIDAVIGAFGASGQSATDVDGSLEVDAVDIDIVIGGFGAVDD